VLDSFQALAQEIGVSLPGLNVVSGGGSVFKPDGFTVFDLPYILTHPLLRNIMVRHAELKEQAESLPQGSAERKTLEKRISRLEQYRLPKEDKRDAEQREDAFDGSGKRSVNVIAFASG
jgi:hypothetical protein